MFLTMTITCLFLFTRSKKQLSQRPSRKRQRDRTCRACGLVMAAALILTFFVLHFKLFPSIHPVFWLETVCIEGFGIAWLVKGQAVPFLRDQGGSRRGASITARQAS